MASSRTRESSSKENERVTLIEQFIDLFHIPFSLGCFLLAGIFGPPGAMLLTYIQTSNRNESLSRTLCLFFGEEIAGWRGFIASILFSIILFYFLYIIRFMRLRLLAVKPELLPILPEDEETFHQVFSPICHLRPPLIIGTILVLLAQLQIYPELPTNYVRFAESYIANLVYIFIWVLFWLMVVGTFLWVYFGSIRGLYQLGTKALQLKSFHEDKTLGTRPIGALSLTFASLYIIGIGLAILLVLILLPQISIPFFTGLLATLILIGIVFFFLPLYSVHKRMLEAKRFEQETVRQQISKVFEKSTNRSSEKDLGEALDRLTTIIAVDVTKGELETIPTWPVDVPILSRFVTIIFSVIGILIANYVMIYLFRWK
jgi:MFS family permease